MLSNAIIVTALLASAPLARAVGSAVVVNACQYQVKLCNVPSSDGGYAEIDKELEPNGTYTQDWTQLSNGNGWSIKLSPDDTLDHILQYEYTFHNDGIIWYDLSEVDGNPWDGNWEITADKAECTPKQQAYRYATDDAYGMQSCPDDTTITVTLCSGEDQNDGAAASASSAAATISATQSSEAPSSTPASSHAPSTTSAPAYSSIADSSISSEQPISTSEVNSQSTTSSSRRHQWWTQGKAVAQPTTLVTSAAATSTNAGYVVTNVVTEIETAYVTATAYAKREQPHYAHHAHPHYRA